MWSQRIVSVNILTYFCAGALDYEVTANDEVYEVEVNSIELLNLTSGAAYDVSVRARGYSKSPGDLSKLHREVTCE